MDKQGLTTTRAPFIENARKNGELFIRQPYELYNDDNQEAWKRLYALLLPKWEKFANTTFLNGIRALCLKPDRIPTLDEVNMFLEPLTGFKAKGVSGYVPTYLFFDSLKRREFPTTVTIRDSRSLHYLPEPDIFHDIAGHVPMHTNKAFAEVLVKFGSLAEEAAQRHAHISDREKRLAKTKSNMQALARFFWFTVEFGLMQEGNKLCVYGSGLLSSAAEIAHAATAPEVQRYPFRLEWVINQPFEIDRFQPLLFVVESFDHLYGEVERLGQWLNEGRLDNVAPGEPAIGADDLETFMQHGNAGSKTV